MEKKIKKRSARVVLSAAYGLGNLGDEAIAETIIRDIWALNKETKITVLVFDLKRFKMAHPNLVCDSRLSVFLMDLRKKDLFYPTALISFFVGVLRIIFSDTFIWGGGGLIRNRTDWLRRYMRPLFLAQLFKRRILVWSIGVDEINNPGVKVLISKLKKPTFLSVRDLQSRRNLMAILPKYDIEVVRDPVFHYRDHLPINNDPEEFCLGLNLSFWKADFNKKEELSLFVDTLAKCLLTLYESRAFKIKYLPTTGSKDDVVFKLLTQKIGQKINIFRVPLDSPVDFLREVSGVEFFVGMRLHSLILASNIPNLPWVGIIYDEKVLNLKNEADLDNIVSIEDLISNNKEFIKIITKRESPVLDKMYKESKSDKLLNNIIQ